MIALDIITFNIDLIESNINLNHSTFNKILESYYTLPLNLSSFFFPIDMLLFLCICKTHKKLFLLFNALNIYLDNCVFHCSLFLPTFLCFHLRFFSFFLNIFFSSSSSSILTLSIGCEFCQFCLCANLSILSLFLNSIFTGHRIPDWKLFSVITLMISFYCLLASIISS